MRHYRRDEAGSVAAELAIALPAVALAFVIGIGALGAAARQVSLQDAVADAARLLSRGESDSRVYEVVGASIEGARLSAYRAAGLVCVTGEVDVAIGRLLSVPLRASACALEGGR